VIHAVAAAGWRWILVTVGDVVVPWRDALSLYYVSQAVGGITPANIGGDIHRVASLRDRGTWREAVASVVIQRATSYVALSLLSLVGLMVMASRTDVATGIVIAGAAFACATSLVAWIVLRPPPALRSLASRVVSLFGGSEMELSGRVTRIRLATMIGIGSGLAFHAGSIGLSWVLVHAIDPGAPLVPVVSALAVARLALAVPVTPSGLGVQEGLLGALFVSLGMPADTALASMLLARISLILTTAAGAVLLARSRPPRPVSSPQPERFTATR